MKRIALILAAAAVVATGCKERKHGEFVANDDSCAFFRGSFTLDGMVAPHRAKPKVSCDLVEKEGAKCTVSDIGISSIPNQMSFNGNFIWDGDTFVITGGHDVFNLRLLCKGPTDCYQLQLWNRIKLVGVGCDLHAKDASQVQPPAKGNLFNGSKNSSFNL